MLTFVGFSPAWQRVYLVEDDTPGRLIRAAESFAYASGKATNAAVVASRLTDQPVHLATVIGGNTGKLFEADLFRHTLRLSLVRSEPTRVCTTVIAPGGQSTELIENACSLPAAVVEETLINVRRSRPTGLALSGSLPPGLPVDTYARLVRQCEGPTIVDAAGEVLLAALSSQPTIVKPNRDELAATVGRVLPDNDAVAAAAQELRTAGAAAVLVTNGPDPALLVTASGHDTIAVPPTTVRNTIGAGDALTGALLVALACGDDLLHACTTAIRTASAKCAVLRPEDVPPQTT